MNLLPKWPPVCYPTINPTLPSGSTRRTLPSAEHSQTKSCAHYRYIFSPRLSSYSIFQTFFSHLPRISPYPLAPSKSPETSLIIAFFLSYCLTNFPFSTPVPLYIHPFDLLFVSHSRCIGLSKVSMIAFVHICITI